MTQPKPPLSENETHDVLHRAKELFDGQKGATPLAENTLRSGEKMLTLLMLGMLVAAEEGTDDPTSPPSPPEQP